MPLTMAKRESGDHPEIAGRDEVCQHLAELGFAVDGTVTVISEIAGSLILQVKDSRTAPDKTMANRIMIEPPMTGTEGMKTRKDAKNGKTGTVAKLHGEGPVKRRMMDMGITRGAEIDVRKVAPWASAGEQASGKADGPGKHWRSIPAL